MMAVSNPSRPLLLAVLLALLALLPAARGIEPASAGPGAATLANEAANFHHARTVANDVLRRPEFQRDASLTWWQQKKAAIARTLGRIFSRFSRIGSAVPWLARVLEWALFGGAALALLLFVLRQLRRQRLQVALNPSPLQAFAWSREADDWSQRADAFARQQQWRDSVHCLYWAAIVLLESRRAWRHNPTRTPREYLRLLPPASLQHTALHGLTHIFERTWYGLRHTTADEYAAARSLYDGLLNNRGASPTAASATEAP